MPRANKSRGVLVSRQNVQKVRRWPTTQTAKRRENVAMANVLLIVKLKDCRVACVILVSKICKALRRDSINLLFYIIPVENACRRCCRTNINETCFPVEPIDVLPDGTPCIQGFCNKVGYIYYLSLAELIIRFYAQGNCEKTIQDVVERFWDIIEDININKVLLFLRDNIVGTVVLVTALLWIPASCVIGYVDRKRRRDEIKRMEWRNKADLIHPSDNRRVIHIRVPRNRISATQPLARPTIPE